MSLRATSDLNCSTGFARTYVRSHRNVEHKNEFDVIAVPVVNHRKPVIHEYIPTFIIIIVTLASAMFIDFGLGLCRSALFFERDEILRRAPRSKTTITITADQNVSGAAVRTGPEQKRHSHDAPGRAAPIETCGVEPADIRRRFRT